MTGFGSRVKERQRMPRVFTLWDGHRPHPFARRPSLPQLGATTMSRPPGQGDAAQGQPRRPLLRGPERHPRLLARDDPVATRPRFHAGGRRDDPREDEGEGLHLCEVMLLGAWGTASRRISTASDPGPASNPDSEGGLLQERRRCPPYGRRERRGDLAHRLPSGWRKFITERNSRDWCGGWRDATRTCPTSSGPWCPRPGRSTFAS